VLLLLPLPPHLSPCGWCIIVVTNRNDAALRGRRTPPLLEIEICRAFSNSCMPSTVVAWSRPSLPPDDPSWRFWTTPFSSKPIMMTYRSNSNCHCGGIGRWVLLEVLPLRLLLLRAPTAAQRGDHPGMVLRTRIQQQRTICRPKSSNCKPWAGVYSSLWQRGFGLGFFYFHFSFGITFCSSLFDRLWLRLRGIVFMIY